MAARCSFKLPTGGLCDAKKSAPIHLRITPNNHTYLDASKAGLKPVSDGRAAYVRSKAHTEAYEGASGSVCAFEAAGAPDSCHGDRSPHHLAPRSLVGGLEQADKYPVVQACTWHNGWAQEDGREWSSTHYVTIGNRDYPLLITSEWLTAEAEMPRA
jgi:hypothetical protein